MLPNFVWFNLPAPDDILRRESITPVVDGIASVCQILFAAALCAVVNRDRDGCASRRSFAPLSAAEGSMQPGGCAIMPDLSVRLWWRC